MRCGSLARVVPLAHGRQTAACFGVKIPIDLNSAVFRGIVDVEVGTLVVVVMNSVRTFGTADWHLVLVVSGPRCGRFVAVEHCDVVEV